MTQQRDDREVFKTWLTEHKGIFFKIVRSYAFTAPDRDDLFQEIATQVWRSVPSFRGESAVTTWIYRVALNVALSWKRGESKHSNGKQSLDGIEPMVLDSSSPPDPRLEWLYEQIAQFSEADRSLTLLLFDGFSYRDMSAMLGITETNVGVRINRIKARLTRQMEKGIGNEL